MSGLCQGRRMKGEPMDKEQAIDLLDNLIGMVEDNQDNDYDTAFRMAIEALKAQLSQEGTTFDMISKIETVKRLRVAFETTVPITDYDGGYIDGIESGISTVSTMPTIQPERQKGEWINTNPEYKNGFYNNSYYCSRCHDYYTTSPYEMKFCPNCGAKMKGE